MTGADLRCTCGAQASDVAHELDLNFERAAVAWVCFNGHQNVSGYRTGHFDGFGHLDHAFGRVRVAESVANMWALDPICHGAKTANHPDAKTWLIRFLSHAIRHEYWDSADMALARLRTLSVKGTFAMSKP